MLIASLIGMTVMVNTAVADEQKRRDIVQKRLDLVESYLNSKTALKISEGDNDQAKQFLAKAQQFFEQAGKSMATGDLDQSAENVDQSIRAFSAAGAANTNRENSTEQIINANKATRSEIDAYLQAFRAVLAEKGPAMAGLLGQQQVADLMALAEKSQAAGDHKGAAASLNQAKQLIVVALTKIRSNETVVYTLEFQTPADEYRYETERYQEYLSLGEQIINGSELEQSRKLMFGKLREKSEQSHQEAVSLATRGDYEAAITQMEAALKKLVQGLQLLGLPVSL